MSRTNRHPQEDVTPYRVNPPQQHMPLDHQHGQKPLMTRRCALKAMLGISAAATVGLFSHPTTVFGAEATQETTDKLNAAQAAYNDAQAKLTAIANESVELNKKLSSTVDQIEKVQNQIDDSQKDLESKQDTLSSRISGNYKTGNADFLSLLLNSASFDELASNLFYMGKINASDEQLIADVKQVKHDLEQQKSQLEDLKTEQTKQLSDVQAKQQEASDLVNNLSDDVKQLLAQRDAEIVAAAEQERKQAEAAAAAQAAQEAADAQAAQAAQTASSRAIQRDGSGAAGVTGSTTNESVSSKGAAIVAASTGIGSPGAGLCAMWVSQVYAAAGCGYPGGNANDMYYHYCISSDKSRLEPGMVIAVPSHPHTSAGQTYGHIGIYIGNGMVRQNIGYINTQSLDSWISYYGATFTPRWGWA